MLDPVLYNWIKMGAIGAVVGLVIRPQWLLILGIGLTVAPVVAMVLASRSSHPEQAMGYGVLAMIIRGGSRTQRPLLSADNVGSLGFVEFALSRDAINLQPADVLLAEWRRAGCMCPG